MPIFANTLSSSNLSNISIESDLRVTGDIYTEGRMDIGNTIFTTFRLSSNVSFADHAVASEVFATSNTFMIDFTHTDVTGMNGMTLAIPPADIYNEDTGVITVPMNGLYSIQLQGSFSNSTEPAVNGVYVYLQNHSHSNARVAAITSPGPLISTSFMSYLLGGDRILPTFYSNDPNAFLISDSGETFVSYSVAATTSPKSTYYRV